jgi:ABC-type nitrate/sulfonate/bicarbonate transport system permease component
MSSRVRRIAVIVILLIVWEAVVRLGITSSFVLAPPSAIVERAIELIRSGELLLNIGASMSRVLMGYSLAVVSGALLGGLMGWFRWLDDIFDPLVELVRPVSPLAILPLAILWLGIGQAPKVFVIWYGCVFPILLNTYAAVRGVPRSTVEAALTLGAQTDEVLRRVVLNHSIPLVLTGARISFAVAMIVIIAAEMVAADAGLGYMILTAQQMFRTADLYVGIVTIALIGFCGDRIIRLVRAWLCPWNVESQQT